MARTLYRAIGRPSEAEFQRILDSGCIRNCPVTSLDAKRALTIYGPDIATLKGKTTRAGVAPRAPNFTAVALPPSVLEHHRDVTLCVDFFFVQGHIFFHTISRNIFFRTPRRGGRAFHTYCQGAPSSLRARFALHAAPKIMIEHMVVDVVRCLNMFPAPGISESLSPLSGNGCSPLTTTTSVWNLARTCNCSTTTNRPTPFARGPLAPLPLPPPVMPKATIFLSLASGFRVARHRWTALPMTDTAIARVEALAKLEDQPLIQRPVSSSNGAPTTPSPTTNAAEDRDAAHGADADDDRDASYGAADDADYQSGADDDDYQYGAYGDEGRQDGIPEDDIEAEDAVDAEDDIDAHIEEPEDIPDAAGYEAGKSRATTLMKHRPWSEVQPAQTKERNGCNMTSETGPTGSRIDSEPPWMSLSAINPISRRPNCYTTTFSSTS
ncbi:Reverse transcriptase (RNA-dependent DNA polymerase) [Fragilaria crotonensis]|nr:Reverse transcriptase (RNA-dependent DNA polymerase) [Fragilaria crotonensis]